MMFHSSSLILLLSQSLLAASSPTQLESRARPATQNGSGTNSKACALVAKNMRAKQVKQDAALCYQCALSVPINATLASATVNFVRQMTVFQASLDYLKNPPEEYQNPPIDLLGELDEIDRKIGANEFSGEWDFEETLGLMARRVYDFHYRFDPLFWSLIFPWQRDPSIALVSASTDGGLPKIYVTDNGAPPDTSKAVTKINGRDAVELLREEANQDNWSDEQARYNGMFWQPLQDVPGLFNTPTTYPGPSTTLTFDDGTSKKVANYVNAKGSFSRRWEQVTDGPSFYNAWVRSSNPFARDRSGDNSRSSVRRRRILDAEPTIGADAAADEDGVIPPAFRSGPGLQTKANIPSYYPQPFVQFALGSSNIAGFFTQAGSKSNVAVLSLPTFVDGSDDLINPFQDFVDTFLEECKRRKSPQLIIDVRSNGGGVGRLALELFKQLFPNREFYQGTNFRVNNATTLMVPEFPKQAPNFLDNGHTVNFFDYRWGVDNDNQKFGSWQDMYGPVQHQGSQYTNIIRSSSKLLDHKYIDKRPAFAPSNIVVLSDGRCGSACYQIVEMLATRAGVRTITIGGLPSQGPMVPTGGSKGSVVMDLQALQNFTQDAAIKIDGGACYGCSRRDNRNLSKKPSAKALQLLGLIPAYSPVLVFGKSVTVLNSIRDPNDLVPTQFKVDYADCRIWYAPEMYTDPVAVWRAAYGAMWGGAGGQMDQASCIQGSTGVAGFKLAGGVPPPVTGGSDGGAVNRGNGTTSKTNGGKKSKQKTPFSMFPTGGRSSTSSSTTSTSSFSSSSSTSTSTTGTSTPTP